MITTNKKNGEFIITFSEKVGIENAADFKNTIAAAIKDYQKIKIVLLSKVNIHLSIIQMILAAEYLCKSKNKKIEISDDSNSLNYLFNELGLESDKLFATN